MLQYAHDITPLKTIIEMKVPFKMVPVHGDIRSFSGGVTGNVKCFMW